MAASNVKGCRFLAEVVSDKDTDFLPEGLRRVLKDFAYLYMPRLHIAAIICRRGGEATVALTHDSDAVYDACLHACVGAARTVRANVIDAADACRRECRGAVDELIRQDVDAGIRALKDLLEGAGFAYKVEANADGGAVVKVRP